jgi:hypothetical protein
MGTGTGSRPKEDPVPEPGSKAYDKERAHLRKQFENQGLPDEHANERANAALRGDLPAGTEEPRSRREAGTGQSGRGRDASGD